MKKRQPVRQALLITSFLLFPITIFYFSPVLIIMGAYKGILAGSAVIFSAMFVISLFFGRAFCGWICPAGGLQEICFSVRDDRISRGNIIKYIIWAPWLGAIIVLFIKAGGIQSIDPLFQIPYGISMIGIQGFIVFYFFIVLIVALSFAVGKRSFCHHVCWMAPFMVMGEKLRNTLKLPGLRLRAVKENCISCSRCTRACPMSLNVEDMALRGDMVHSECILCGSCADICNKEVIHFTF